MIKKTLLLLSLLLVSCTNNAMELHSQDNDIYYNVYYNYVYEKHCYCVYIEDSVYNVPPSHYYKIKYSVWTEDFIHITNEYFVSTNELFVYVD